MVSVESCLRVVRERDITLLPFVDASKRVIMWEARE